MSRAACWNSALILSRHTTTRISRRTKPLSFIALLVAARPWVARYSKRWATIRSTISAPSRIGLKAAAQSTSQAQPVHRRGPLDKILRWGKAGRNSGRAADQVRSCCEPDHGQGTRPHGAADAARATTRGETALCAKVKEGYPKRAQDRSKRGRCRRHGRSHAGGAFYSLSPAALAAAAHVTIPRAIN